MTSKPGKSLIEPTLAGEARAVKRVKPNYRVLFWPAVLACFMVSQGLGRAAALPGLVGWWPGEGSANDASGTNNGTLLGGATASALGKIGRGFSFDGTNGFVSIPDAPQLKPATLTIEAWVLFTSLDSAASGGSPPGEQFIVFKQNSRSSYFEGFFLGKERTARGDVFSFMVTSAAGQERNIESTTLLSTGVWYHVAGVRGSNYAQLYVNGRLEAQTNVTASQDYGTTPLMLGSSGQSYWDHKFAGMLDEVSLYSRPLSGVEITNIYAAGVFGYPSGDITFYVGSDLHYGYVDPTVVSASICRSNITRMNGLPGQLYPSAVGGGMVDKPRGVLLIGDLTDSSDPADWAALTNDWGLNGERSLSWPVYEAYGNHDVYTTAVPAGIKARNPYRRGVTNISTNGYHYSWDWDFLHMVCLNMFPGQLSEDSGPSPRASLAFLVDDLAKNVGTSGRPVVIYHHFGLDSFSLYWWTEADRSAYLEAIRAYNVIAIFAGHNHAVDSVPWNGFNTFNDGTIGKPRVEPYLDFLVVHVTPTNMAVVERRSDETWGDAYNVPITTNLPPRVLSSPSSAIATAGSEASFSVQAIGPGLKYQWIFNATNAIAGATNSLLLLTNLHLRQSGAYVALITNSFGAAVSQGAELNVVAPLRIAALPALALQGDLGASVDLEYCDALTPEPVWHSLGSVILTNTAQLYLDPSAPSGGQRFYRKIASAAPLGFVRVPMITVFGAVGDSVRLEYAESSAPDALWQPLTTFTLTNSFQTYLDDSPASPDRRYRAVAAP
jgi:hypothetical protein